MPHVHLDLYDNWLLPHIGGVPPSWRVGHAWARAGDDVYVFGGTGSTWRRYGAVSSVTKVDEDDDAGWSSLAYLNDLHGLALRTSETHYPSHHAPDLQASGRGCSSGCRRVMPYCMR